MTGSQRVYGLTYGIGRFVGVGYTGSNVPIWAPDGKSIIENFAKEGQTNLGSFDVATGGVTEITKGNQAIVRFRAAPDSSKLVYFLSTPTKIGDLLLGGRG